MPFVKLDCGILNSTLWFERTAREIFITSLLMAEPFEALEPMPQIAINSLEMTGWSVPPGWYGFIPAAGIGIIHRAQLECTDETKAALASLGEPEASSRSHEFDGRRLVRVNGGFIVLNFIKYRDKDSTTAERSRRWRERQKEKASRVTDTPTRRDSNRIDTIAEAEAEAEASKKDRDTGLPIKKEQALLIPSSADADFEAFRTAYPASRRVGGKAGKSAWKQANQNRNGNHLAVMLAALEQQKRSEQWQTPKLIPLMTTWLNQERWNQVLPEPSAFSADPKMAGNIPGLQRFAQRRSAKP